MGVQTSSVTTASGNLTIQPVGETKIKSVTANNPGTTPLACDNTTQALKKFVITDLPTKATLDGADSIIIHDSTANQTKRVLGSDI